MPASLPLDFYLSSDVVSIARQLLGCKLCTNVAGKFTSGIIVETEAYRAPEDKASHAYNGRRTPRTETMYCEGGISYVYLCYGIHHLFNVVTGPNDVPHAVLIRAIEPLDGIDTMLERRKMAKVAARLTAGPGSLAQALGLDRSYNMKSLLQHGSDVWIEQHKDFGYDDVLASPRVGVAYAEECAEWPWRFRIKKSSWTSPAK